MINEFIADKRKKYDEIQKNLADPAAMKKRELKAHQACRDRDSGRRNKVRTSRTPTWMTS